MCQCGLGTRLLPLPCPSAITASQRVLACPLLPPLPACRRWRERLCAARPAAQGAGGAQPRRQPVCLARRQRHAGGGDQEEVRQRGGWHALPERQRQPLPGASPSPNPSHPLGWYHAPTRTRGMSRCRHHQNVPPVPPAPPAGWPCSSMKAWSLCSSGRLTSQTRPPACSWWEARSTSDWPAGAPPPLAAAAIAAARRCGTSCCSCGLLAAAGAAFLFSPACASPREALQLPLWGSL